MPQIYPKGYSRPSRKTADGRGGDEKGGRRRLRSHSGIGEGRRGTGFFARRRKNIFFEELGIKESGLDKLVRAGYKLLGLISYLTAGEKETRAWTIKEGTKAPQAAGKIHSDFEKGFIRAEIVPYETLLECGNYNNAKEKGKVRSEGKDYVIKDGDVVLFRFNV